MRSLRLNHTTPDQKIKRWKIIGYGIIFTNGCYDVLHIGHIRYLTYLKNKYPCYKIIIGLNSNDSIKRNKGNKRPINSYKERKEFLYALKTVDLVMKFNEKTPLNLIKRVKPNILAKGGDYEEKMIVGEEFVKSYGGKIDKTFYVKGKSSTSIIKLQRK